MSSKNILQFIEKEKLRDSVHHFWSNEDVCKIRRNESTVFENSLTETPEQRRKQDDDDFWTGKEHGEASTNGNKATCMENISMKSRERLEFPEKHLVDGVHQLQSDSQSNLSRPEQADNRSDLTVTSLESDSNMLKERSPELDKKFKEINDTNEIDYYDSEDEYWGMHENEACPKDDVIGQLKMAPIISGDGRYSKGLEQYVNLPIFKRSIKKFALDNNFEIEDVISDGNCMFRAVADQLLINGCPGHTETSLRHAAIQYLRSNPFQKDGSHASSFLSDETWDDYLARMARPKQWSDHIVLQALADKLQLDVIVFNVYLDDIRRTEIIAESEEIKRRLTIFLGHLGEFHYLSLRPKQWRLHWPYKALLYRLLAVSHDLKIEDRLTLLKNSTLRMASGRDISKSELDETAEIVSQIMLRNKGKDKETVHKNTSATEMFKVYSGQDLQNEETEDSLQCLIEDPLCTDPLSGIPLPHLSFILKQVIPSTMLEGFGGPRGLPYRCLSKELYFHFIGSYTNGNIFTIKDITRKQCMRKFYHKNKKKNKVVIIRHENVLPSGFLEKFQTPSAVYYDDSNTYPGYCRLKLCPNHTPQFDENVLKMESESYLQAFKIGDDLEIPFAYENYIEIKYIGFACPFWPLVLPWLNRKRNFDFPSQSLVSLMTGINCTLIPKAHPKSRTPSIEWKINFAIAEHMLFANLTQAQRSGFALIKVLIDNMTFHLEERLKTKHLKAVFLNACENIPSCTWDNNFGGCILFVLSELVSCLRLRCLPHYFIPAQNLLDCFSPKGTDTICVIIEAIRTFPAIITQFIAEKHGFVFGTNLVRHSLKQVDSFLHTRDVASLTENTLIPISYRVAKVLAKMGFYTTVCQLLKETHRQLLILNRYGKPQTLPNLLEFFCVALQQMRQRSSRIILAKMYDFEFGTKMADLYLNENDLSLEKLLPWVVDYRINWLEVPKENSRDLASIAMFLYDYSINEYIKRNANLSTVTIETAISCIRHTIAEDSINVTEIEDERIKQEIISQQRGLREKLRQCYLHVYDLSRLDLCFSPLMEHMPDIETLCEDFPEMSAVVSRMYAFLKRQNKSKEYAAKFASFISKRYDEPGHGINYDIGL